MSKKVITFEIGNEKVAAVKMLAAKMVAARIGDDDPAELGRVGAESYARLSAIANANSASAIADVLQREKVSEIHAYYFIANYSDELGEYILAQAESGYDDDPDKDLSYRYQPQVTEHLPVVDALWGIFNDEYQA